MPSVEQLRSRLLKKLNELFQINQPDLDFGFYRIMHIKAQQVNEFINQNLVEIVNKAFGQINEGRKNELQAIYEKAIQTAKDFGAPNPAETEPVKKAKAALVTLKNTASAEADIYDHLYRFFERYYDNGDFISRRYYARETPGRAAPFAVPYNGEEVKLHWANADQYYIKTTEYFNNYVVDLRKTQEVQQENGLNFEDEERPFKVHFRIVDASEGEHGNVKASEDNERFFIIHKERPVEVNEDNELVINFEYRYDPEKTGKENTWRARRNNEAVEIVLAQIQEKASSDKRLQEYLRLLKVLTPTESNKKRLLLEKYINQYTTHNTIDYFIHKDLGGFLRRELDFYIKNEILRLDDIEGSTAFSAESYLMKIKILRRIAHKVIDFLAQLEDFQKKLWLKKKFIVETNYCITLDLISEKLYSDIAKNKVQCEEWVKLFAIDKISGYSNPLTEKFLKANYNLVLDTRFFDEEFKARLLDGIKNFDEQCNGILIHSENFQALSLIQKRYWKQVKCTYIDPPYNTTENAFLYKNAYKHSSWLALLSNVISISPHFMPKSGVLIGAIDDTEYSNLKAVLTNTFGENNYVGTIAVEVNPAGQNIRPNVPARSHDYFHIFAVDIEASHMIPRGLTPEESKQYKEKDSNGSFYWDNLRRRGGNSRPVNRPKQWFPLFVLGKDIRVPEMLWDDGSKKWIVQETPLIGEIEVWPIHPNGEKRIWRVNSVEAKRGIQTGEIAIIDKAGRLEISKKCEEPEGKKPKTLWAESKYSATSHGTKLLLNIFGPGLHFSYPKSIYLTTDAIRYWADESSIVMDYFAGSGTTGHAVINLNREDGGDRKYILVEMGNYFDTVLKPRIAKVIYARQWKNGKPQRAEEYIKLLKKKIQDAKKQIKKLSGFETLSEYEFEKQKLAGEIKKAEQLIDQCTEDLETGNVYGSVSHCFQYIRLESFEDTLNNLRFAENPYRDMMMSANASLREDYILNYLLEVETKGSQSLLNIEAFSDPTAYQLKVKKPGSDEYVYRNVDLIETFNYLIGLRALHITAPNTFTAAFHRNQDPELPLDQCTKLVVNGQIEQVADGPWWFRKVEGWIPKESANPNNGQRENILIIWRKLTGDLEKDNLMLDEWFRANCINNNVDIKFDIIYVNGSSNLLNLRMEGETWKVRMIEEEFMKRMWDIEA
jgi:adenine-specific DNA-methyltransferase